MMKPLLAACVLACAPLTAAHAAADDETIDADERLVETPRPVAVAMPQAEIETLIELGRIGSLYADSLVAAVIVNAVDNRKDRLTRNAEREAADAARPLISALEGFDVAALALETTRQSLALPQWFNAGAIEPLARSQAEAFDEFAQANPAQEMGLVTYQYQLSPDCTQIRVVSDLKLIEQEDQKTIYSQQVVSLVRLARPSFVCEDNVALWAADDGALARSALTMAFDRLQTAIPAVLELDEDAFEEATDDDRESAFGGGFHGPLLFRDDKGPVLWSKRTGFIAIQSVGG